MNKAVAEIIAGVIPNKMARNRWRGILRYGPVRALKLMRRLRNDHSMPDHYLGVCAIAKNEGPYFKEWIDWHLSKGVDRFYIYDNESTDNTRSARTIHTIRDCGISLFPRTQDAACGLR